MTGVAHPLAPARGCRRGTQECVRLKGNEHDLR